MRHRLSERRRRTSLASHPHPRRRGQTLTLLKQAAEHARSGESMEGVGRSRRDSRREQNVRRRTPQAVPRGNGDGLILPCGSAIKGCHEVLRPRSAWSQERGAPERVRHPPTCVIKNRAVHVTDAALRAAWLPGSLALGGVPRGPDVAESRCESPSHTHEHVGALGVHGVYFPHARRTHGRRAPVRDRPPSPSQSRRWRPAPGVCADSAGVGRAPVYDPPDHRRRCP